MYSRRRFGLSCDAFDTFAFRKALHGRADRCSAAPGRNHTGAGGTGRVRDLDLSERAAAFAARRPHPGAARQRERPAPAGRQERMSDAVGANPIRVLIADDQALIRRGMSLMLDVEPDIEVVGQAADGAEAIALSERLHP